MNLPSVLYYTTEASEILAFLMMLPGACAAARKWAREHRRGYRPRHARARGARSAAAGTGLGPTALNFQDVCPLSGDSTGRLLSCM
jgi:hypothetical protein